MMSGIFKKPKFNCSTPIEKPKNNFRIDHRNRGQNNHYQLNGHKIKPNGGSCGSISPSSDPSSIEQFRRHQNTDSALHYKEAFLRSCSNRGSNSSLDAHSVIQSDEWLDAMMSMKTVPVDDDRLMCGYVEGSIELDYQYSSSMNSIDQELPVYTSVEEEDDRNCNEHTGCNERPSNHSMVRRVNEWLKSSIPTNQNSTMTVISSISERQQRNEQSRPWQSMREPLSSTKNGNSTLLCEEMRALMEENEEMRAMLMANNESRCLRDNDLEELERAIEENNVKINLMIDEADSAIGILSSKYLRVKNENDHLRKRCTHLAIQEERLTRIVVDSTEMCTAFFRASNQPQI